MPLYIITERAGRFVAGHSNTGVGTTLELTERAAQHEVRLGTLIPFDVATPMTEQPAPADEPVAAPSADTDDDDAPTRKPRRSRKAD